MHICLSQFNIASSQKKKLFRGMVGFQASLICFTFLLESGDLQTRTKSKKGSALDEANCLLHLTNLTLRWSAGAKQNLSFLLWKGTIF